MFPHQPSGKRLFVGTLFGRYIYIDGAGINRRTTRWRFYLLKSESPREHQHFKTRVLEKKKGETKLRATVVAVFMFGLGPTLLTAAVWRDDRHGLFFPVHVHGDLASLFSHSSVPLSFVGSVLCGCSGCKRALPESVTGMLATSSPGYIKPYWCASKMLPKLADDAAAAKAVGGDRCYLSSPAASSQIVPSNKAINLIDKHISFIAHSCCN